MDALQQPCLSCFVRGIARTEYKRSAFADTGERITSDGKKVEIFFPGTLN